MFERYTEKARRVIFFARFEASQFGSPLIETEHLLLGLLREDKALTYRLLRSSSALESIPKQVEAHTVIREMISTSADLPLSEESKRVLTYSYDEAARLGHKHIGTEHLLLGLLRDESSFAAVILKERGLALERAREELAHATMGSDMEAKTISFPDDPVWRLIHAGVKIARPETCIIDPDVQVAAGTIIEPFAQLLGRTVVGAGCRVRSFSDPSKLRPRRFHHRRRRTHRSIHPLAPGQRSRRKRPRRQLRRAEKNPPRQRR
jgi:hypothetical protein